MRNPQRMPLTWPARVAGLIFALNVPVALLITVALAFPVFAYGADMAASGGYVPPAFVVFLLAALFTVAFPVAATLVLGVRTRVAAVACCVIAALAIFGITALTALMMQYIVQRVLIIAICLVVADLIALLLSFETLRRPRPDPFAVPAHFEGSPAYPVRPGAGYPAVD